MRRKAMLGEKEVGVSVYCFVFSSGTAGRSSAPRSQLGTGPARVGGRGFTLIELLVVVVIIGLLTAVVGPRFFGQIGKSEQGAAKAQIDALAKALDAYRLDVGRYPTTEQGLVALTAKPSDASRWNGPYLQRAAPPDPWGHAYVYKSPGAQGDFDLLSLGKDGQPGGDGEDSDISFR